MIEIKKLKKKYSTTACLIEDELLNMYAHFEQFNAPDDKFISTLFLPKAKNRSFEGGLRTKGYFKKTIKNKPLISIVTVVLNGGDYIEQTILSVINQSYDNVEYILIDGGSSDATIDIIKKYEGMIDYWVSEKDNGIYDAMNKGISLCSGDIVGILNSDDYYTKDTFEIIKSQFEENIDLVYCDFNLMKQNILLRKSSNHNLLHLTMSVFHPSVFIRKSIYKKYGLFDSSLKISADYKLLQYLYKMKITFKKVDNLTAVMRLGGVSTNSDLAIEETFQIQKENSVLLAYLLKYLRLFKKALKC